MYRKMVEGVVAAVVPLLKKIEPHGQTAVEVVYRNGILDTVSALLLLPGVSERALFEKVKRAFDPVHLGFVHTKLAEERIVDALIA